ncbi:MAG: hypothetical protein AAB403_08020 [Planctomycetota bacterium]|mgnify:CR=1 FL=1
MPLPVPNLDDRTFDQLASEARGLIPKYFPDWTDHNLSDPGITLLELFAFLMEAALYRLNRVPEATLENFAALVGISRRPSEPVESMLRRAVQTVGEKNRAIASGDIESIVTWGVVFFLPALESDHDAGTEVETQFLSSEKIHLDKAVEPKAMELFLAAAAKVAKDDELLIEDEAHTEFIEINVEPEGASKVSVKKPLRFAHAKGVTLHKLLTQTQGARTRLALPARKDDTVVILERSIEPAAGNVFRLGDAALCQARFARVKVVPIPGDPCLKVIFVPGLRDGDGWPINPDEQLCDRIFEFLRPRCLITTRLEVVGPEYQDVDIKATVIRDLSSRLPIDEVRRATQGAIRDFLDPLKGGPEGKGWEFGRALFISELFQIVEEIPGVDHVDRLEPLDNVTLEAGKWSFKPTPLLTVSVLDA